MASQDAENGKGTGDHSPTKGTAAADVSSHEDLQATPTKEERAGHLCQQPPLRDYSVNVPWTTYFAVFAFTVIRVGLANFLTQRGITEGSVVLSAVVIGVRSSGPLFACGAFAALAIGTRGKNLIAWGLTIASSLTYGCVYGINPRVAHFILVPSVLVVFAIGIPFCQRRIFACATSASMLACQMLLVFMIQSITQFQSRLPEASQQFLVPIIRTLYVGFVTQGMTCLWKKTYRKPAPPVLLTLILLLALISQETMGLVALLTVVDSNRLWENAMIFCAVTVVMETNSRSGILISGLYRLMGKQYYFSDAAQVFRWGKMWVSYGWICAFTSWVVPALINGLEVKDSKFSFRRWEPWALLGMYVAQQIMTDAIFVCIQHYLQPSASLCQTASRCLILGEATPFFGANEHAASAAAESVGKEPQPADGQEEYESQTLELGPVTVTKAVIVVVSLLESSVSVWGNYTQGHFGLCGTFIPGWESGEEC